MLDSVPIGAWYAASLAAAVLIAYRIYSRRAKEQARRSFAERRAAVSMPQFSIGGGQTNSIIPWAIQQARGGDRPLSPDRLTREEARLAELAQAAITLDDRSFRAACRTVSESERMILEYIRRMAGEDARVTLDQPVSDEPDAPISNAVVPLTDSAQMTTQAQPPQSQVAQLFKPVDQIGEWLPGNGDPDLWHLLVGGLSFDHERTLDIVDWIVRQPDCDRATAALTIAHIGAYAYKQLETLEQNEDWSHHVQAIVRTVCERSEVGLYPISRLNLSCVGHDNDQRATLDMLVRRAAELEARGHVVPWPQPVHLLSTSFEGRDALSTHYEVHEDGLYLVR